MIAVSGFSQAIGFSIATDLGLQRSFKKEQKYYAGGHTVHALFHFTKKEGLYLWVSYYSNGKFFNEVTATAKDPLTFPQELNYLNRSSMRFKHISTGWKHYFKGGFNMEEGWNIYGYAGFGIMLGRIDNSHSIFVDTSAYNVPVYSGRSNFKRLTLDLGLGWETPIGADIFFYSEGRLWVPTTDYPSKHIFVNENAPLVAMVNFGIRILF